jgi:photosystem II stability/assembly factor-like uncharacterized protein
MALVNRIGTLLVVSWLLVVSSVQAGINRWTRFGPEGGDIHAFAIDQTIPTTLYAGGEGVFKSTDGGQTWAAINTGLPNSSQVNALVIDPIHPSTLYAGTNNYGVFKSTDGGQHWTAINTGLFNTYVSALALDPTTPTTLYAGGEGVFKSTDGGQHWTAMNTGLSNKREVNALAFDPTTPTTLYAGTLGGGVIDIEQELPPSVKVNRDLDGDGKADLVWRHTASGAVGVWLMNGGTLRQALGVTTVADLRWQVQ